MAVEVKSSWASKINWTQFLAFGATVFALFGVDLDPETQVAAVAAIQGIQVVVTWIMRTWFTTKLTTASVS